VTKRFEAESPDEAALVAAAQVYHFELQHNTSGSVTVSVAGRPFKMEVLQVLPFESDRKRMSGLWVDCVYLYKKKTHQVF
jgi:magnesium-transporting ATPase (P-type)